MLKKYEFIKNFNSPVMVTTGMPQKPHRVMYKKFKKGQLATGRLHSINGNASCILINDQYVVPLDSVRPLTVEPNSNVIGGSNFSVESLSTGSDIKKSSKDYTSSIFMGGIMGLLVTVLAEQKGYINPQGQNKIWGIFLGATLLGYITYEHNKYLQKLKLPTIK